jgi:pyrimidine-nucleoside phosphorylase
MMDAAEMRRAIARKRDGGALDASAWQRFVAAYLAGKVDDAQAAALLMACVLRGMEDGETRALTEAFVASGERLDAPDPRTVDKHSSGGVGDTASLIVVPLVAACGIPVAKLSGRALGHTGGTLDKLEAIEGVRVDLDPDRFFACVREAGCAIAAQSARLVPADKRIYALRDHTATVPALGLIAASIVSKKIAGGAHAIVYDVKVGRGAFVAEVAAGRALAETLVALTLAFGRRSLAILTDMDEPLGPAIGTGLEAIEAREFLSGARRDARLGTVCEVLGAALLRAAGFSGDPKSALDRALNGGHGYEVFERMLQLQGAAPDGLQRLAPHRQRIPVAATQSGYVTELDPVALGECARDLVARCGPSAGIVVEARSGTRIAAGQALATIYGEPEFAAAVEAAFSIGEEPLPPRPLVYDEIGATGSLGLAVVATPAGTPRSTLESR